MSCNSNIAQSPKPNVLFESSKIKYPNTGLYTFCKELSAALFNESKARGGKLSLLMESRFKNRLLAEIPYKPLKIWHKCFLRINNDFNIWHAPFQLCKYYPKGNHKVILTIHDLNFLYEKSDRKIEWYKKQVRRNIQKADHIVTISEYVKQDVLKYFDVKEGDITVIYNGATKYDGDLIKPKLIRNSTPFLFTVGTILPKKNFHVLPSLLVGNNYNLVISGNPSSYNERIIDEARKWGVEERVIITGAISEEEKNWLYKNCEAFLFPSIAEGFGLPVVEAMRYGKPIFLSKHTSLPEIGGDNAFYFDWDFTPEKMRNVLLEGIKEFNSNPNIKENLINRANNFSWENAAKSYYDIYESILQEDK
ncbi:MAG: glycosyltransferase family 4 protein [Bacteroidales bacterium]